MPSFRLIRRGFELGSVDTSTLPSPENKNFRKRWLQGNPIVLNQIFNAQTPELDSALQQSFLLYAQIIEQGECSEMLNQPPLHSLLQESFVALGGSINQGDEQEIKTLFFDAVDGDHVLAEDLWLKVSWLSFFEQDASMRFRFSFGEDMVEDVASDPERQHYAAELCEAIFPESRVITDNGKLLDVLYEILETNNIHFVERIVYFNARYGGAYLHHDHERGHAGVVYAQLSGHTYWLALPKLELIAEIGLFIQQCMADNNWPTSVTTEMRGELSAMHKNRQKIAQELDGFNNSALIHLINETERFVQQLIQRGHGYQLNPGDFLLLPQDSDDLCCWHCVFSLGEKTGEALSFAIRANH